MESLRWRIPDEGMSKEKNAIYTILVKRKDGGFHRTVNNENFVVEIHRNVISRKRFRLIREKVKRVLRKN